MTALEWREFLVACATREGLSDLSDEELATRYSGRIVEELRFIYASLNFVRKTPFTERMQELDNGEVRLGKLLGLHELLESACVEKVFGDGSARRRGQVSALRDRRIKEIREALYVGAVQYNALPAPLCKLSPKQLREVYELAVGDVKKAKVGRPRNDSVNEQLKHLLEELRELRTLTDEVLSEVDAAKTQIIDELRKRFTKL